MYIRAAFIVSLIGLFAIVSSGCSADEEARTRISDLEAQVSVLRSESDPIGRVDAIGDPISDRGLELTVRRVWIESDASGQLIRVVADVQLENKTDLPQANRFTIVALTPRGEAMTLTSWELDELAGKQIENWTVIPADSSQRGYVLDVDYRAASWAANPISPQESARDLLSIEQLLVFVEGSAGVHRIDVEPDEGAIYSPTPPSTTSSQNLPTVEFWNTYLYGSGGDGQLLSFNPATALARLTAVIAIDQTGHDTGHSQAIACETWILAGTGSPTDCNLTRVD